FLANDGAGFCSQGVLGRMDVPQMGGPEAGYGGDALAITSDQLLSTEPSRVCMDLVQDANGVAVPFKIPILRAFDDKLELDGTQSIDFLTGCFGELIAPDVRTKGVYTVVGTDSGFFHRVEAGVDGRCQIDPRLQFDARLPDTYLNGRAFPDRLYM